VGQVSGLLLTDIHEPHQVAARADVCDVLQVPAFLSRQTDLVTACAQTGRAINLKKGQWMAPEEMRGPASKCRAVGAEAIAVTERGTFLGYGDLVVDMRSFARLREAAA
jgi:2-dehydro-3-deoxyphosphooctonate aldolase (KDO 8-P synthase)